MSKKKPKAQKLSLHEFGGGKTQTEDLSWAEDEHWGDESQQATQGGEEGQQAEGGDRKRFGGFKVGSMENFRDAPAEQLSTVVPLDMQAPFMAHVGNLPSEFDDSRFKEAFEECNFNVLSAQVVHKGQLRDGKGKTTFGYIEFESREELQRAILLTGRNVGGRRIKVDIATDQQRERLKAGPKDSVPLSRDSMEQKQPEFRMGKMKSVGSMGEFSRDDFESSKAGTVEDLGDFRSAPVAQPPPPAGKWGRNPGKVSSPNSSQPPSAPADFGSWRDSQREEQPPPPQVEGAVAPAARKGKDAPGENWRSEKAAQPEPANWRDQPVLPTPQPKKTIQTSGKSAPKPAPKPQPEADNRFAALRK
jgi:hypothetical protein